MGLCASRCRACRSARRSPGKGYYVLAPTAGSSRSVTRRVVLGAAARRIQLRGRPRDPPVGHSRLTIGIGHPAVTAGCRYIRRRGRRAADVLARPEPARSRAAPRNAARPGRAPPRSTAEYPPGLEAQLDGHFARVTGDRAADALVPARRARAGRWTSLDHFEYRRDAISIESRLPGGSTMHRAIAKGVGRQIQGVLEQAQDQSHRVARTIALMAQATNMLADAYDTRVIATARRPASRSSRRNRTRLQQILVRLVRDRGARSGRGRRPVVRGRRVQRALPRRRRRHHEPLPRPRGPLRGLRSRPRYRFRPRRVPRTAPRPRRRARAASRPNPRLVEWARVARARGRRRARGRVLVAGSTTTASAGSS